MHGAGLSNPGKRKGCMATAFQTIMLRTGGRRAGLIRSQEHRESKLMVSRPISDKAEVSIDFPEKFYHGSFGHQSRYEVTADDEGVHIYLVRGGPERRHVGFHVHYQLLAD